MIHFSGGKPVGSSQCCTLISNSPGVVGFQHVPKGIPPDQPSMIGFEQQRVNLRLGHELVSHNAPVPRCCLPVIVPNGSVHSRPDGRSLGNCVWSEIESVKNIGQFPPDAKTLPSVI